LHPWPICTLAVLGAPTRAEVDAARREGDVIGARLLLSRASHFLIDLESILSSLKRIFPTPQDAESAFYRALEQNDLTAMMEVWADDEEIVCIHPGAPRLVGYDQVRESWARIFAAGQKLNVRLTNVINIGSGMVAVHSLHENLAAPAERTVGTAVATNVYVRSADGWRLVAHHASPAEATQVAATAPARESPPDPPKTLH
jgi:uncharacterized protein (TIGR02246 family)